MIRPRSRWAWGRSANYARFTLVLLLGLAALCGAVAGTASAQVAPGAASMLKLDQPTRTNVKGRLVLSATLVAPDAKVAGERRVGFYQHVDLLGSRDALLGSATTDASGVAVLVYEPAQTGRQVVTARFAGADLLPASEASITFVVDEAVPPYDQEPLPYLAIRPWLTYLVSGAIIWIWLVLLFVLVRGVVGTRACYRLPPDGLS